MSGLPARARGTSEIREYIRVLSSRKWTIFRVVVAVLAATAGYTALQHPAYEASAQVLVTSTSSSTGSGANNQADLTTEKVLVASPAVADLVIHNLGLSTSATALTKHVKVSAPSGATILSIVYNDGDSKQAARIANGFADAYVTFKTDQAQTSLGNATDLLRKQVVIVEAQMKTLTTQISAGGSKGTITAFQNKLTVLKATLIDLQAKIALVSASVQPSATVIRVATPPTHPVSPSWPHNLLAAGAASLAIGLVLAFSGDALDDRIKDRRELQVVSGVPTLAEVPWVQAWSARKEPGIHLIRDELQLGGAKDAFSALATNVVYLSTKEKVSTLMVTSAVAGEGKTVVAANLGVHLAEIGRKVCLIDMNLGAPDLDRVFVLKPSGGLSSLLQGSGTLEEVTTDTLVPNLRLVSGGGMQADLDTLATVFRDGTYLDQLRAAYDFLIIDTPAVGSADLAAIIGPALDGAVLVVDPDGSAVTELRATLATLRNAGVSILGTVQNGARAQLPGALPEGRKR